MAVLVNRPIFLLLASLVLLWVASRAGVYLRRLRLNPPWLNEDNFNLTLTATLTLLGLITGFTFSMAVSRYDQRKNYEAQEANAIGTEYVRSDILPAADAAKVRVLLRDYLGERIVYFTTRDADLLSQTRTKTSQLESELWSAVMVPATAEPSALSALVLSGMNEVVDSEGYTEAAWRNRVPPAAWVLLIFLAVFGSLLLGYQAHGKASAVLLILPIALSISFALIADIDSPRGGVIRVQAPNLQSLADSLRPR